MSPTVSAQLETRKDHVRKWGTLLLALADEETAVPTSLFGPTDHLPIALPTGYRQLGFITTDGVKAAKSISTEKTTMVQSLEPVREDITEIAQSLACVFGQASSALVNGILHGKRIADLPADAHTPWIYHDGEIADFPSYRLMLLGQDGVGPKAFYRVELGYSAKISAIDERTLNRSTAEGVGLTFSLTKDPVVGKVYTRAEDGPAYHPPVVP
jgi:hypothetical protein